MRGRSDPGEEGWSEIPRSHSGLDHEVLGSWLKEAREEAVDDVSIVFNWLTPIVDSFYSFA